MVYLIIWLIKILIVSWVWGFVVFCVWILCIFGEIFEIFNNLDWLLSIIMILFGLLIFKVFMRNGNMVGLMLFVCVFIVIFVNGVKFIDVLKVWLFFMVVNDVLLFKCNVIRLRLFFGLVSSFVVWLVK